jgi:ribosomal protein S12 methylthiotransferase
VVTTGGHFAYLKIAEGCDKHCTYCIIPKVRGKFRSVPLENLVAEARTLAESGVKELILVAQETTLYGVDLYGRKSLPKLLHELAQIPGICWIRILYCYPEEITDELIDTIAAEPKVCHYLDIPIQHASDSVLKRMGRLTDEQELRDIIGRLRERIPDICLRTTLISGFPGETQEDFEELYRFVNEMEFDRLGVFPYSQEEDTPAAGMEEQIPDEVKNARRDELMELQQAIAFEKAESLVGQVLTVMIEGKVADEDTYVARTYRDAPNVDGYLFLNTTANLMTGDFAKVLVTDSNEYDLIGELYHE